MDLRSTCGDIENPNLVHRKIQNRIFGIGSEGDTQARPLCKAETPLT